MASLPRKSQHEDGDGEKACGDDKNRCEGRVVVDAQLVSAESERGKHHNVRQTQVCGQWFTTIQDKVNSLAWLILTTYYTARAREDVKSAGCEVVWSS